MRARTLAFALAPLIGVLAACGGSDPADGGAAAIVETIDDGSVSTAPAPAGSIQALLDEGAGEDVALVMGSADFAVGENHVRFLILRGDGSPIDATSARVFIAPGGFEATPSIEASAQNLQVGATSSERGDEFDTGSVWVADVSIDEPGPYTLLVEPEGESIQAVGQIDVKEKSDAPAVGSHAIAIDNPTVADDFPDKITTATPPDVDLLQTSVAAALEAGQPFVVTFATPKYCQSRVCGPVVEVVDEVRTHFEGTAVRFIHVEIYESNDPSLGFNRWVQAWNLPTEPWTFVVDGKGVIRESFEGLVTADELDAAVREHLL